MLLKPRIPVRTWAEWDDAVPVFVEIDLVAHEVGNAFGESCFTLTATDVSTGWTVNRSARSKQQNGLRCPGIRPRSVPVPDHRHRFHLRQRITLPEV